MDLPSPIRQHVKWKMARTKKLGQMTSEVAKEIADMIISDSHLSMIIFYNNCWMSKPILFLLLTTGFHGEASLIGKLCRPWTLGCIDRCHWATRAPWSCSCCWSQCHHKAILWIDFTNIPQFFLHAS